MATPAYRTGFRVAPPGRRDYFFDRLFLALLCEMRCFGARPLLDRNNGATIADEWTMDDTLRNKNARVRDCTTGGGGTKPNGASS